MSSLYCSFITVAIHMHYTEMIMGFKVADYGFQGCFMSDIYNVQGIIIKNYEYPACLGKGKGLEKPGNEASTTVH